MIDNSDNMLLEFIQVKLKSKVLIIS
jgi:hypothetical protein